MNHSPIARTADIVVWNLDHETLIYDLTINKAYMLNETSAFIWNQLDGKTSIAEINRKLGAHFKQKANEDIVWLAIEQLKKDNLLKETESFATPISGINRREVIKKVGLATMLALPIVTVVSVPQAAHAASLQAACGPCTTGADCQNGVCSLGICANSSGGNRPRGATYESITGDNTCSDATSNCCSRTATFDPDPANPFSRRCRCQ